MEACTVTFASDCTSAEAEVLTQFNFFPGANAKYSSRERTPPTDNRTIEQVQAGAAGGDTEECDDDDFEDLICLLGEAMDRSES